MEEEQTIDLVVRESQVPAEREEEKMSFLEKYVPRYRGVRKVADQARWVLRSEFIWWWEKYRRFAVNRSVKKALEQNDHKGFQRILTKYGPEREFECMFSSIEKYSLENRTAVPAAEGVLTEMTKPEQKVFRRAAAKCLTYNIFYENEGSDIETHGGPYRGAENPHIMRLEKMMHDEYLKDGVYKALVQLAERCNDLSDFQTMLLRHLSDDDTTHYDSTSRPAVALTLQYLNKEDLESIRTMLNDSRPQVRQKTAKTLFRQAYRTASGPDSWPEELFPFYKTRGIEDSLELLAEAFSQSEDATVREIAGEAFRVVRDVWRKKQGLNLLDVDATQPENCPYLEPIMQAMINDPDMRIREDMIKLYHYATKSDPEPKQLTQGQESYKTLRDVILDSRNAWIEHYTQEIAEEEGIQDQADLYQRAVAKLGDAFIVYETNTSLKNLFRAFKMIAQRGVVDSRQSKYGNNVFCGVSPSEEPYSVEYEVRCGGDEVSVSIGHISFGISEEPYKISAGAPTFLELKHHGYSIPWNILTQLLDGRVDGERMAELERGYTPYFDPDSYEPLLPSAIRKMEGVLAEDPDDDPNSAAA
jgi:hypothetical protein